MCGPNCYIFSSLFVKKKDIFDQKKFTWYLSKRIQLKFLFFIFLLLVTILPISSLYMYNDASRPTLSWVPVAIDT